MLGNWHAISARGLPYAWCHCLLAVSREGTLLHAGLPCHEELKHQVIFSHYWGKEHSRNKNLFSVPVPVCKWCWAASGLPSPCPPQGFGLSCNRKEWCKVSGIKGPCWFAEGSCARLIASFMVSPLCWSQRGLNKATVVVSWWKRLVQLRRKKGGLS